jgi:hypothetical protein
MYSKMKILCIYSCLYDMKIFARILPPHRLSLHMKNLFPAWEKFVPHLGIFATCLGRKN